MFKDNYVSAIVLAAGLSSRMNTKVNKQFLNIDSKPVLAHSLKAFQDSSYVDEIILVTQEIELDRCRNNIVKAYGLSKVKKIIIGGSKREDSFYNGLKAISAEASIVISHDGARPFIRPELIDQSVELAYEKGACVLGVPVKDTIKYVEDGKVDKTPDRSKLWAIQTPQTFRRELIEKAYKKAFDQGFEGTDDSSFVENLGVKVSLLEGDYNNIKITTLEDMSIANAIAKGDFKEIEIAK